MRACCDWIGPLLAEQIINRHAGKAQDHLALWVPTHIAPGHLVWPLDVCWSFVHDRVYSLAVGVVTADPNIGYTQAEEQ